MNIMVFSTHILWPSHFETELELMQRHVDDGDEIVHVVCNGHLHTCDQNQFHSKIICLSCILKRKVGVSLLSKKIKTLPIENCKETIPEGYGFDKLDDFKEVVNAKIDNFDIGNAVCSSIISWLREPCPDLHRYKDIVNKYFISAYGVYRYTIDILKKNKTDKVYVFNGRFAHVRAILRACQKVGVDCLIHERGSSIYKFALYENFLPHNIKNTEKLIKATWASESFVSDKEITAARYYEDRVKGVDQAWYSFVKEQDQEMLPVGWDANVKNIVIFNSSEDEFASIGEEWKNPLYTNQLEAMRLIIKSLEEVADPDFHVYLRIHPNNKGMSADELKKWYSIKSRILTIIPHDSKVSTYLLLKSADKVLTFGSTVGIEAVFWGKPSILAGSSFYKNLGGTYNPESHEELIELLLAELDPGPREAAMMYGYYLSSYGSPYKYFEANSFSKGCFKNVDLNKASYKLLIDLLINKYKYITNVSN